MENDETKYRDESHITEASDVDQSKVPSTIKKLSMWIRQKKYGEDVRESIARGIEKSSEVSQNAVDIANDTASRQDNVDQSQKDFVDRYNNQIAGNTDINEVIDARDDGKKTFTTLRERLNQNQTISVETVKNSSWFYNNIKPLSAHRGAHIDAPENTAMAVAHAGMYGYGLIECDPRLTSDNQVVLMHDDTVDRMTDGTGKVSDFTLNQLKQMKVDAGFAGKNDYNTIRIPTLSEILYEVNRYGMGVNIDGGKLNWRDDNVINIIVGVIKQAGLMGRSIFTVSDLASRKRLNALYPEAALSWTDYDNIDDCIAEAKTYINAVPTVVYGDLSRNYRAVLNSGLPLHVWGVNSTSQYYDSIQHGARFVETDSLLPMTVTTA